MVHTLQIIALLFSLAVAATWGKQIEKRNSRLILEYDWPEPKKNLHRFPHSMSCSHFYLIRPDGSQAIKKCPQNELFDFQTLRCRDKTSAKCWNDLLKKDKTKKMRRHFKCPFPWGLYPDTEDCSMFYDCLSGKPYPRKCPDYTLFDKAERTCVEEHEAMCADNSDVVEPDYKCPYKWGFFTYSKDCSKYYECLRKVPSLRTCKTNMLFDNFKRKCLPMGNVVCGERFNPYGRERVTTERIPTGSERVSVERISTASERMSTERISTGSERMSTERISTGSERMSTGRISTGSEQMSTQRISTGSERVSTERISTESERVSTERISTESERVSTGRISTGSERVSTGRISTGSERVSTGRISTGSERVSTGSERMSTERISTGSERVSTGRISTGSERVSTERISTGSERVSTGRISTGSQRVSTGRISTGHERVSTERIPTGRERVTSGQMSSSSELFPTEGERVSTERISTK